MSLLKKWKAGASALALVSVTTFGAPPVLGSDPNSGSDPSLGEDAVAKARTITVIYRRLDNARNALSSDAGTSQYQFSDADIANLPQGNATPLNQVLLQAPGIVQDGFGQVHVRGDHGNLQYRVNGVIIPEAISGFGQVIDTRFADQINVITI